MSLDVRRSWLLLAVLILLTGGVARPGEAMAAGETAKPTRRMTKAATGRRTTGSVKPRAAMRTKPASSLSATRKATTPTEAEAAPELDTTPVKKARTTTRTRRASAPEVTAAVPEAAALVAPELTAKPVEVVKPVEVAKPIETAAPTAALTATAGFPGKAIEPRARAAAGVKKKLAVIAGAAGAEAYDIVHVDDQNRANQPTLKVTGTGLYHVVATQKPGARQARGLGKLRGGKKLDFYVVVDPALCATGGCDGDADDGVAVVQVGSAGGIARVARAIDERFHVREIVLDVFRSKTVRDALTDAAKTKVPIIVAAGAVAGIQVALSVLGGVALKVGNDVQKGVQNRVKTRDEAFAATVTELKARSDAALDATTVTMAYDLYKTKLSAIDAKDMRPVGQRTDPMSIKQFARKLRSPGVEL